MMNKQIKGLTVDEVKESLFGLLPDYTDFVVGDLSTLRFIVYSSTHMHVNKHGHQYIFFIECRSFRV